MLKYCLTDCDSLAKLIYHMRVQSTQWRNCLCEAAAVHRAWNLFNVNFITSKSFKMKISLKYPDIYAKEYYFMITILASEQYLHDIFFFYCKPLFSKTCQKTGPCKNCYSSRRCFDKYFSNSIRETSFTYLFEINPFRNYYFN